MENESILKNIKVITQGYDYPIPSKDKKGQFLFRSLLGHSRWLYKPLVAQGITDPEEQKAITAAMIYEFNEMLSHIAKNKQCVYHIDCRGLAKENEWNDELHLYSSVYQKIALTIKACIESDGKNKVWVAKNQLFS